jgi:hypothetical protein
MAESRTRSAIPRAALHPEASVQAGQSGRDDALLRGLCTRKPRPDNNGYLLFRKERTPSKSSAETAPEIRIDLAIAIPRDYVPEEEIRIDLYRRLARLNSESEASDLANEIADRFGPLPDPVRDIIDFCAIRAQCASSHVRKLEAGPSGIAVTFEDRETRTLEASLEGLGATNGPRAPDPPGRDENVP